MKSNKFTTFFNSPWFKYIGTIVVSGCVTLWLTFWYLSGTPLGVVKYFYTYYVASHFYMDAVPKKVLFEGSLAGMIDALEEPHSQYLTSEDMKLLMEETRGSYSGVGIMIGNDKDAILVVSAVEGQPAAQAGIVAGDKILSIEGHTTKGMSLSAASQLLRGKEGTTVQLVVLHDGKEKPITLTRKTIKLPTVKGKMLTSHIGYIRITQFSELTGKEFAKEYEDLQHKGMDKLILDLRNNPGGLLFAAEEVGNYLLPKGPIVTVQTRDGEKDVYESSGIGKSYPLVVLVNKGSASASEIIAAAVQDEHAGIIVGTQSYGKGTVQTVLRNFDHEGIKITIAKYHTPANRVIDKVGVTPDVVVDAPPMVPLQAEDVQLLKAIEILEKK